MPGRFRASVAALCFAAACGVAPGPGGFQPSPPTAALAAWQSFPASQAPRPIVLLGIDPLRGQGFDSGGGKMAALCARFALSTDLPVEAPTNSTASWADGTKVTYPAALSARESFAALTGNPKRATNPECASLPPLPVTAARFDLTTFPTDRGKAQLSAWLFTVTGARAEFPYPAIPTSAFWGGGISTARSGSNGATVSADGRTLTYFFTGAQEGTGPCQEIYRGAVAESASAVAVATGAIPHETPNGGVACNVIGYPRSVLLALAAPLRGRVVVDSRGGVVPVCPEARTASC
jgi:hypothetical protein